jgi:predicted amidohydrolase
MPNNIVIALWSHKNQWNHPIATRFLILEDRLRMTARWITALGKDLTGPFKAVFLAPEYLFTEPAAQRQPLTEAARLRIEQDLLALSRKYPEILMVPGTVFYKKPLTRDQNSAQYKFDPVTGLRDKLKTTGADRRDRLFGKAMDAMFSIPAQRTADDWRHDDWVMNGYDADGHAVPSLNQIVATLGDTTNPPKFVVKNVAYVLLAGRRIAKYDKQSDWGEALGNNPDDLAFIPGVYKQCPEIDGYRVGTEICFDHGNGMLARRNVTPLHFHFAVSDWVETSVGNMAMSAGGYFAHASTNFNAGGVWRRKLDMQCENITEDTTYWKYKNTQATMLDGYVVPLPAPIVPALPDLKSLRPLLQQHGIGGAGQNG